MNLRENLIPKRNLIVFYNIKTFGRTKNYNQNVQINYKIPINKIPLTNWISSNAKYSVRYLWSAGSFQQADTLGNIVENSRNYSLSTKMDISKFYDKLPFLKNIIKRINQKIQLIHYWNLRFLMV